MSALSVPDLAGKIGVATRTVAALISGYAMSWALVALMKALMPGNLREAGLAGAMLGFLVFTGIVIWVFAARTVRGAVIGATVPAAVLLCLAFIARGLA